MKLNCNVNCRNKPPWRKLSILSNDMISVMNGINSPASFGFSGSFMDAKPFYHKFAAASATSQASAAAAATSGIAVSSATNENDRTSTPPALATR